MLFAHAPSDLASLVEEVERLRAIVRQAAEYVDRYGDHRKDKEFLAVLIGETHER